MTEMNLGVIDLEMNPFTKESWVDQKYGITYQRMEELNLLFGKTEKEIRDIEQNIGSFPAFVGIRWGFAEMKKGRLTPTSKWESKELHDKFGNYKKP